MALALSPQRRRRETIPEVVICVPSKRRKPSAVDPVAARKLNSVEAEEVAFAGLSRIEQIRLQARRKAEQEDKEREEREKSKATAGRNRGTNVGKDDDEDEAEEDSDDELPDLISIKTSSSLKSAPSMSYQSMPSLHASQESLQDETSSSLTTSTEEVSSSFSLPQSQLHPNETSMQRGRRSTARLEPYIFRPSLDPISDRRKKLQDAKESAAVQAKLVKTEDFKRSVHTTRSDTIEKVLREHKREQRKGLDADGLHDTIAMVRNSKRLLDEEEDRRREQDRNIGEEGDQGSSSSESDAETSSASSSSSRNSSPLPPARGCQRVRFKSMSAEDEMQKERLSFVALTGDENDDTEVQEAFDILRKDRENAERRRQFGEADDKGMEKRKFWRDDRVKRTQILFPELDSNVAVSDILRDAFASRNRDLLIQVLRTAAVVEQLKGNEKNTVKISIWLFEIAILIPTSELSFAALQAINDFLGNSDHQVAIARGIISHFPTLLLKLGAKYEIVKECFQGTRAEMLEKPKGKTDVDHIRRGERKRATERLLRILEPVSRILHQICSQDTKEQLVDLFIVVLRLGVEPQLNGLEILFERLLETLLEASLEGSPEMDSVILSRLTSNLLGQMAPTAQVATLSIMPVTSIRSRALQRSLAHSILNSHETESDAKYNYSSLVTVLSDKSRDANPFLPSTSRDYKQIEANVQLLCYTFNDLPLQLLHREDEESSISPKISFTKVIQNYFDCDTTSFLSQKQPKKMGKEKHSWKISKDQIDALHQILELLQILSNQIQDGKGAFLDRSKVKDQLQRLRLMLLYELGAFGLTTGDKASSNLQQGSLSKWLKP